MPVTSISFTSNLEISGLFSRKERTGVVLELGWQYNGPAIDPSQLRHVSLTLVRARKVQSEADGGQIN